MDRLTTDNITGIIVSYNEAILLTNCYRSIRRYYPYMKIIIIDGSNLHNPCYKIAQGYIGKHTQVISTHFNIGHGKGMKLGISLCNTDYFLLIDSDTKMIQPPLQKMISEMDLSTYGIGEIIQVDKRGLNQDKGEIHYLHPYFALINKHRYNTFKPIIHHGAPMIQSMIHIHGAGATGFLKHFPVPDYVEHYGRGTRKSSPDEFHPKTWEKVN